MNLKPIKFLYTSSIIIALSLYGCHSSKNASKSANEPYTSAQNYPSTSMSSSQKVQNMVESVEEWTDISLPLKCRITQPKKLSVSGRATMIRGKEINISLRMLGFEVAGLYADRDSFIVFEKLNKTMISESMSKIEAATGLTLSNLQDALIGRVCYPGEQLNANNLFTFYKVETTSDQIILNPKTDAPWSYRLSESETIFPKALEISIPGKIEATCSYEQFDPIITGFCKSAELSAVAGRHTLNARIEWSLGDAKVDNGLSPKKPSFKNYRRITFAQLIKMLGSI